MALLATAAAGVQLPVDGVRNFRSVSYSLPGLYRSGALEAASERDAARILDSARIRTVLDLRSDDEIERARRSATRAGARLVDAYSRGEPVGAGCLASEGSGKLRRVHVPLLGDVEVRAPCVALYSISESTLELSHGLVCPQHIQRWPAWHAHTCPLVCRPSSRRCHSSPCKASARALLSTH
jgi:hypothetical protein